MVPKRLGGDREVEDADDVVRRGAVLEAVVQLVPGRDVGDVERHVVQPGEQPLHDRGVEVLGHDVLAQRVGHQGAVAVVVDLGAGDADDAEPVGQLPVPVPQVERGEELAQREVAGATEDGEVAGVDGG